MAQFNVVVSDDDAAIIGEAYLATFAANGKDSNGNDIDITDPAAVLGFVQSQVVSSMQKVVKNYRVNKARNDATVAAQATPDVDVTVTAEQ